MIKVLLFLFALVISMFLILYSELTWQLIIVFGKKKVVLNFWFAMLVILLSYLTIHWLIKQFMKTWKIPEIFREYRIKRRMREKQFSRGQAIIYSLTGNYRAAVGHLPIDTETEFSDLILSAVWLNQLKELNQLDIVLGRVQALNKIPDGWMVWFRAYLLFERGKVNLACDLLLDAIESGVYTTQVLESFVKYADPQKHYSALLKHYYLLSRYVSDDDILPKLLAGAKKYLDDLVQINQWEQLSKAIDALPKSIRQNKEIHYYRVVQFLGEPSQEMLPFLMEASFSDERLIPLLAKADIPVEKKISIVVAAIEREPKNKQLLYLLSYLHAQSGDVDDSVKLLENAIKAN